MDTARPSRRPLEPLGAPPLEVVEQRGAEFGKVSGAVHEDSEYLLLLADLSGALDIGACRHDSLLFRCG
jgi:hypothetical protein